MGSPLIFADWTVESSSPNDVVAIEATGRVSAGWSYCDPKHYRYIGSTGYNDGTADISEAWAALYGDSLNVGDIIWCRLRTVRLTTGVTSAWSIFRVVTT